MRRLRGTPMDPFGKAEVRRVERALIGEYRELVHGAVDRLHQANHEKVAEIAGLADMVRGYEDIKLRNVERFRAEAARLEAALAAGRPAESPKVPPASGPVTSGPTLPKVQSDSETARRRPSQLG